MSEQRHSTPTPSYVHSNDAPTSLCESTTLDALLSAILDEAPEPLQNAQTSPHADELTPAPPRSRHETHLAAQQSVRVEEPNRVDQPNSATETAVPTLLSFSRDLTPIHFALANFQSEDAQANSDRERQDDGPPDAAFETAPRSDTWTSMGGRTQTREEVPSFSWAPVVTESATIDLDSAPETAVNDLRSRLKSSDHAGSDSSGGPLADRLEDDTPGSASRQPATENVATLRASTRDRRCRWPSLWRRCDHTELVCQEGQGEPGTIAAGAGAIHQRTNRFAERRRSDSAVGAGVRAINADSGACERFEIERRVVCCRCNPENDRGFPRLEIRADSTTKDRIAGF